MAGIKGKYLLVLIAMCGLIGSALGMLTNAAGVFFTPIAEEFGVGRGSAAATLTVCSLSTAVAVMFAPKVLRESNFKLMLILGTAVMAGCTALLAAAPNIWVLYGLNLLRGAAGGILGVVLVTTVINHWFVTASGLATSVAMAFSGLTGAVVSPLLSGIIAGAGWRTGYLAAAGIIALLNLPAILLPISMTPEKQGLPPLGGQVRTAEISLEPRDKPRVDVPLFLLVLGFGLVFAFLTSIPQHFPGIGESYGLPAVGTVMLSVCMVSNTASKVLLGILIDKIGTRRSLLLWAGLVLLSALGLLLLPSTVPLLVSAALLGLSYSLSTVGIVMLTKDLFGMALYGTVYPKITFGFTLANAFGASVIGFLYDLSGGYNGTLWLSAGLCVAALTFVLLAYRRARPTAGE